MKTQTREIDGLTVRVQELPFMRANRLMHERLAPIFTPLLEGGLKADVDFGAIARTVTDMGVDSLMREILQSTTVELDGKALLMDSDQAINAAFTGRVMTAYKALAFTLEVNYKDFLTQVVGLLGALKTPEPSDSNSTTT